AFGFAFADRRCGRLGCRWDGRPPSLASDRQPAGGGRVPPRHPRAQMRIRHLRALVMGAVAVALVGVFPSVAQARFDTALDTSEFYGSGAGAAFGAARGAGTSTVRLQISWRSVAPAGSVKPAGFNPTIPAD